ncbi:hypothetical protein SLA2020_245320 [Shorea laevis]
MWKSLDAGLRLIVPWAAGRAGRLVSRLRYMLSQWCYAWKKVDYEWEAPVRSGGPWLDFPFFKFSDGFADIDGGRRLVEIVERWLAMDGAMVVLLQF